MSDLANVSFRIDKELKSKADALFSVLGLNMTTAFNIFLRQSVREGRIPFDISANVPNAYTPLKDISNMSEAELNSELEKGYNNMLEGKTKSASEVFDRIHREYKL